MLVVIIGFLGQEPKGPRIILNQEAPTRIVAEFPFSYVSEVQSQAAAAAVRAQVPPVFQRSFEPFENFREFTIDLNTSVAKTQIEHEARGEEVLTIELEKTAAEVVARSGLSIAPDTIIAFTTGITPRERSSLMNDALNILEAIYQDGIYPVATSGISVPQVTVIQTVDESGLSQPT